MKISKIAFVFFFSLFTLHFSLSSLGQSMNVQSAANSFKDKDLAKAKQYIDLASENAQTANDPKMWYYRGMIYLAIYNSPQLTATDNDAPEKAAISFINCIKTDKGKNYTDEAYENAWVTGIGLYNKANEALRNNDAARAEHLYNLIFDLMPYDKNSNLKRNNITADILNRNLYLASYKSGDLVKAKGYVQKLIDAKYNDPVIYLYMTRIDLEQKDTAKAIEVLEQGRNLYSDNSPLIMEQIRLYALRGRTDELVGKISDAIDKGQDNELLYYTRGVLYEQQKSFDKAAADYKKAIELKSDYTDAYFNLGNMYVSQAAEMVGQLNNLKPSESEKYEKLKAALEAKLKEAQPYMEQAREVNPKKTDAEKELYQTTLKSLKQIYVRTNQLDKYNQVKEELEKEQQ